MKYILQESKNPLVDYDATYYSYGCGFQTIIAYIHGLRSDNPCIEFADYIVNSDILTMMMDTIKKINKEEINEV